MPDIFLDEILTPFFTKLDDTFRSSFLRGQIYWSPCYYAHDNLEFWRPADYDEETKTYADRFSISTSTADAFRRRAPLYAPKLEVDEEFIVTRAKRRPVILLTHPPDSIGIAPVRSKDKLHRNLCLATPLYSVVTADGTAKYPTEFINRVRKLEYPNLFFVPAQGGHLRHSICRLESMQAVCPSHLEATDLRLSDDVLKVFLGQANYYMTGNYEGDYQTYREIILAG